MRLKDLELLMCKHLWSQTLSDPRGKEEEEEQQQFAFHDLSVFALGKMISCQLALPTDHPPSCFFSAKKKKWEMTLLFPFHIFHTKLLLLPDVPRCVMPTKGKKKLRKKPPPVQLASLCLTAADQHLEERWLIMQQEKHSWRVFFFSLASPASSIHLSIHPQSQ